jgi:hypothetical protein
LSFSAIGVEKMTVLLKENAVGESSSTPPRKKLCLSLSGRTKVVRVPHKAAHVNESNSENAAENDFKDKYQELNVSSVKPNSSSDFGGSEEASTPLTNSELHSGNNSILNLFECIEIFQAFPDSALK